MGYGVGPEGPSRLRMSELATPTPYNPNRTQSTLGGGPGGGAYQQPSPEKMLDILKQQSPIRRKFAHESIGPVSQIVDDDTSPYKRPLIHGNDGQDDASYAASKIAQVR